MSTTIDQRVVEMQFDNRHFERNVSTTMSTLDKFKQMLHLDGATRGLENINTAARNVDLGPLGGAVQTVQAKFSALQVMGVTALTNITNSAINAGKRMVSALTIDPIKTGFQEYETQINAVQTILANTESKGTTIDDVNKALEELNQYADKTIYNFTEMTRNIGTFTAAGVDLDTSVNAIQGIANLAAVSGSTSQQASTAMYQLSQALSSGTVKLMDWNSVVNAGMGGEVFQNALKETARVHGVAIDDMIKEQGSFRETLSEGWLTSEILTDTLQKFTMTTEGLTEEQIKANREMLRAKGYTDEQIDGIFKLGNTATNAATKVKTFTQLWDVLKESAQSGWSQTWKIIIGDFEEAKAFLTPVADVLTGIINKFSNARNEILEKVFGGGRDTKWNGLAKALDGAGLSMTDLSKASELLTGSNDELNKSLDGTGTYVIKKGDYLDKIARQYGTTWQELYKLNKEVVGDDPNLIFPNDILKLPEAMSEAAAEMGTSVDKLTDAQLKSLGYTDEQIKAWRQLEQVAKDSGLTIEELLAELSKPRSGRDLLIESFQNAFEGMKKALGAIKDAWQDIFPPTSADEKAAVIYRMIEALNKFSQKLIMNDETADKLRRTFRGLFALIDIVATIAGGAARIAFKVLTSVLKYFNLDILDLTAIIGDALVQFRDWFDSMLDVSKVLDIIVPLIVDATKSVSNWFNSLNASSALTKFTTWISNSYNSVVAWIKNIKEAEDIPTYIIQGLVNGLKTGVSKVATAIWNIGKAIITSIKDVLGIHSPSTVMIAIGGFIIAGLIKGIIQAIPDLEGTAGEVLGTLKRAVEKLDLNKVFAVLATTSLLNSLHNVTSMFKSLGDMFSSAGDVMSGAAQILTQSAIPIAKTIKGFANTLNSIAFEGYANGMKQMAIALAILVASIIVLTFFDPKKLWNSVAIIAALSAVLLALAMVTDRLAKGSINITKNAVAIESLKSGLLGMAVALLILAITVRIVGSMDTESAVRGFLGLIGVTAVIVSLVFALSKIATPKNATAMVKVSKLLTKLSIVLLIFAIVAKILSTMTWGDIGKAAAGIGGFAAVIIALMAATKLLNGGKNIDKIGSTLLKVSVALGIMTIVAKLIATMTWDEMGKAAVGISGLVAIIVGLMAATKLMSGSKNVDTIGSTLLKVALAIGIMAIVAKLIAGMSAEEIAKGVITITAFSGIIVGLMAATKLINGSKGVDKIGSTLIKVALAIGIMAIVIKLIAGMSVEEIAKGVMAIAGFAGIIVGLMAATKLINGSKGIDKVGNTIIKIALAIGIMGIVVRLIGGMSSGEIEKGMVAIAAFGGILLGLVAMTKLVGKNSLTKVGATLLSMAAAIGILALVTVLLGFIDTADLAKGLVVVGLLSGFMALMIVATKNAKGCEKNLYAMAVAIGVMAAAIAILSFIPMDNLANAVAAMSILMGMFALMEYSAKSIKKGSLGPLIVMVAAIGVIGLVMALLAKMPIDNVIGAAAGLSVAIGAMSLAILALGKMGSINNSSLGPLIVMAAAIGVIGLILALLATLPIDNVMGSALSLSLMVGVLSGILIVFSKIKIDIANAELGVLALLSMAVPLIAFVGVLAAMQGVQNAMSNALVLSVLATAMSLVLLPLTLIGSFGTTGAPYLGALALLTMAVPLIAFVGVLAAMQGVQNAMANTLVLTVLATAMTVLLVPLTAIGAAGMAGLPYLGALALLTMAVPLIAFVGVLAAMQGVQNALDNTLILTVLATAMTVLLVPLTVIGAAGLAGLPYLGALALLTMAVPLIAFVGVLASMQNVQNAMSNTLALSVLATTMSLVLIPLTLVGLMAAQALIGVLALTAMAVPLMTFIGVLAVMEGVKNAEMNVNLISTLMTSMSNALVKVALVAPLAAIGVAAIAALGVVALELVAVLAILGGLSMIPGFNTLIADGGAMLASIGTCLSQFMIAMMPFITGAKMVDPSVLAAANILGASIIALTVAELVTGIMSLSPFAGSLADMGTQLSLFMMNAMPFITGAMMISPEMLSGVKALADTILILTAADIISGLTSWFGGGSSLEGFANQLPVLGRGLAAFSASLGTFTEEQMTTVMFAAKAVKMLAKVATEIPNTGGLLATIVGENDLSMFASQFPVLGSGLSRFITNVGTFTDQQVTTVSCAAQAIKTLAKASSEIPNTGGLLASIVGGNDLGTFADQFPVLGSGLANFLSNVGTFSDDQVATVKCAASAIKSLASVADSIPNSGGFWSKITGDNDLGDFASKFPSVGKGLKGFVNELGTFGSGQVATVNAGIKAVNSMAALAKTDLSGATANLTVFGLGLTGFGKNMAKFCSSMPETNRVNSAVANLNKLLEAIKKIADVNSGTLSTFADNLMKVGENAIRKFVSAFTSVSSKVNVNTAARSLAQKAIDGFKSKANEAKFAGFDLGTGLVLGIRSKMTAVYNAGYALGQKAVQGEKDGQKSKSPSKATIQAGKWLGEGLIIGMEQMGNKVYAVGHGLGKMASDSMSASISRIVDAVNSDIDTQPTIRPVLDLTNVRAGASALNGLLDTGSSVGVVANVSRISGMMNSYSQNGVNSEIVSAINKLNKRMDDLGNTTYQINGVTYDDGSNITDAVRTIVRAARIERRT